MTWGSLRAEVFLGVVYAGVGLDVSIVLTVAFLRPPGPTSRQETLLVKYGNLSMLILYVSAHRVVT